MISINPIQAVFENPDLRRHILSYKTQNYKIKKCQAIYVKWNETQLIRGVHLSIYTRPTGMSHLKTTFQVEWSIVYDNNVNVHKHSYLLVSDHVENAVHDWVVDTAHLQMKNEKWYIHEWQNMGSHYDYNELILYHTQKREYIYMNRFVLNGLVNMELEKRELMNEPRLD